MKGKRKASPHSCNNRGKRAEQTCAEEHVERHLAARHTGRYYATTRLPETPALASIQYERSSLLRGFNYVRGLRAFLAFGDFELHRIALLQAFVTF